jgi:hypothetical protein
VKMTREVEQRSLNLSSDTSRARLLSYLDAGLRFVLTPVGGRTVFALFALGLCAVAVLRPAYGWDLIAYVAVTKEAQFETPVELHGWTYDLLRRSVGEAGWKDLTDFDDWRRNLYTNPDHFVSQLGFYRPKAGYVWAIDFLGQWTGAYEAGWILSFVFGLGIMAVFLRALTRLELDAAALFFIPVMLAANVQWLIRLPSPDAMSGFFVIAAIYLWVFRAPAWGYAVLALAVLTRPDNLLLVMGLAIAQVLTRRVSWQDGFGLLVGGLAFWMTKQAGEHVGWWPHFYFTNVAYVADMKAFDVPFTFKLYLSAVLNGVVQAIYKESWLHIYLLMIASYVVVRRIDPKPVDAWDVIVLGALLALGGRIIAFPFLSSRIMCPTVLMTALAVAAHLRASRVAVGAAIRDARPLRRETSG